MRRDAITRKFSALDLHDDNLISVLVRAPRTKKNDATVVLEFEDDGTRQIKILSFHDCANLRFNTDFDVLANNWIAQTEQASCNPLSKRIARFVRSQKSGWHVTYMPPMHAEFPIRKKLLSIHKYRLFKITFFGGTIEILGKSFALTLSKRKRRKLV
jgi:hypothetical protein